MAKTTLTFLRLCADALLLGAGGARAELGDGDVLGPDTWQQAEGLLPAEILEHYRRGEYVNTVLDIDRPGYLSTALPADFQAASKENRGRYALDEAGTIIDPATGRQPAFILGSPFPDIDPADPQAAIKIIWNHFYVNWYNGGAHLITDVVMLNRHGVERSLRTEVWMRAYDGAPEARGQPNSQNLALQTLARVTRPADLEGIVSLTWRYRDARKPDSLWTYVPGVRRVRQVSPLNRSDGFMGSDLSLDDGPFFDGKPEDFTFRLLGAREQLVLVDPYSLRGESEVVPAPGGGWRIVWKDVPRIGADLPGWTGVPWAPVSAALARRKVWMVEAVPKDPNYLFGRMVLSFDAATFHGGYATKYDRADSPMLSYQVSRGAYASPEGGQSGVPVSGVVVRTAENLLYGRATVVLFPPRNPHNPSDFRVDLPRSLFSVDALMRAGK